MAGIGFQLRHLMRRQDVSGVLQAYGYAALISSGPWLLSIGTLALLGVLLRPLMGEQTVSVFFSSVTHVYAFSLIITGPLQLTLTRHAADLDFLGDRERILPTFLTAMAVTTPFFSAAGLAFFLGCVPGELLPRLSAALLFTCVCSIWVLGIYLSAMKNYTAVLAAYATGYGSSFFLAWICAAKLGSGYTMLGFTIGHIILVALILGLLRRELGGEKFGDWDGLRSVIKFPELAGCGLLYNLAVWSDKFIHWWLGPEKIQIAGALYAAPIYDQALYMSFLTIMPGMAVFLLKVETDFAEHYESFYRGILNRATLDELRESKQRMTEALTEGFSLLIKVQGVVTGVLFIFAEDLLPRLGLGALQTGVFQITIMGSFLLVIYLGLMTVLFYFDKRLHALGCCALFFLCNTGFTLWDVFEGEQRFGLGLVLGVSVALFAAACMVKHHLDNLEYDTFTSQPIST